MPDINEIIVVFGEFLGYAVPITCIFAVGKAGLGIIYKAITGKD